MRLLTPMLGAFLVTLLSAAAAQATPYRLGRGGHGRPGYGVRLGPPVVVFHHSFYTRPAYYDGGYYAPAPGYYYGPQAPAVYAAAQPAFAFGLGLRVSGVNVGRDLPGAGGLGLVARFRGESVEGELEIGQDKFNDDSRLDTRIGAAVLVPLLGTQVQPYVVVGLGLNVVHFAGADKDLTQGYLAAGGGLQLHLGPRFDVAADVRVQARKYFEEQSATVVDVLPTSYSGSDRENAVEARLNAILYF